MSRRLRFIALALIAASAAHAAARFSGEKGSRRHLARLAAGQRHNCAVLNDGTVQCWGQNTYGQLGDGTTTTRLSPVAVANLSGIISISAGAFHTCALSSAGTVSCWGLNDNGRLGSGSAASSTVPVAVTGLTGAVAIAAGGAHSCAVKVDGTVWCWGAALANGTNSASLVPVKVNLSGAVTISTGGSHTCALMTSTQIMCWGDNSFRQLGDGSTVSRSAPAPVVVSASEPLPLLGFVDVSAGGVFTCASRSAGIAVCWGSNVFGQFGISIISDASDPVNTMTPSPPALTAGGAHTCVILADGTAMCFGHNDALQLGSSSGVQTYVPFPVFVPGMGGIVEIAAGLKHTCAALVDGSIHCWGDNTYGQHGDGVTVQLGIDSVAGIAGTFLGRGITAGNQFECARRGAGAAACWGSGTLGQLGNGAGVSSSNPAAVTGIGSAFALAAGRGHACAIDAVGAATCWGDNSRGQLGNGQTASAKQPVAVQGSRVFVAISAGDQHTCAIDYFGRIFCWGAGDRGQLGNGGTADSPIPVEVNSLAFGAVAIAAGGNFNCALFDDSQIRCWGDNTAGQLGNGTTGPPVRAPSTGPGLAGMIGIAAGVNHACALSGFGNVLCWGANSRGQIGNNSTVPALVPALVQGLTDAVSISAGAFFTCAGQAGGTASCWGANDSGELGTKDSGDHLTPALVAASVFSLPTGGTGFLALNGVTAIATGTNPASPTRESACALLATGVIRCWGGNSKGEIGDGTTANRARPTVAANVDPSVAMRNTRIAEVTALIDCDTGDEAHLILSLEQGVASGTGQAEARCEGRLVRVPMTVPAQGPNAFQPGAATAHVEAIVRNDGTVVEDTHWTRQVVISIQ
jgi:alpha-tubulin suppressor-like RCC1 family protein